MKAVKFMIGQIGTAKSATKFLESLRNDQDIARTTFITSVNSVAISFLIYVNIS